MQLSNVQKLITEAYNVLTHNDDYQYISDYMCTEEFIHDSFWPLHKKLCLGKGDLRTALNNFSETAEKSLLTIYEIRNLIERDKENKKAKREENRRLKKEKEGQ